MAEPIITLGKKPTLANRRLAFNRLRDREMVVKLFDELGPALRQAQRRLPAHPEVRLPPGRQRADGAGRADGPSRRRRRRRPTPGRVALRAAARRRAGPRPGLCVRGVRASAASCRMPAMDGKILVTGGAGYVGSHVVAALAEPATRRWSSTTSRQLARGECRGSPALTGRPIDLVEADVRDADGAARGRSTTTRSPRSCIARRSRASARARSARSRTGTSTSAARSRSPR